ncbi:hypothetical protein G4X40_20325 [Rhodococcus sp. D2-41]|uniref:hypothetical protein n=1 Tax=Speluncibacter jeojiensis TaxID=2710754 RepID=UPI00240EC663|nr:hypothetical protein [Rhodococcus sp. D2-41]MDG3012490.1 hypothetical protein [Rhodococcus sp. D2-41]
MSSLDELDDREQRRYQRELAREEARAKLTATLTDPDSTPTTRQAAAVDSITADMVTRLTGPAPFELVGDLPESFTGRGSTIPKVRAQLIEFAKAHRGQWIKYLPSAGDPFKSPSSLALSARKGNAGFGPGFETAVRSKVLFVRYTGGAQ